MGKNIEWADLEALMDEFEFKNIEDMRGYIYYLKGVQEDYEHVKGRIKSLANELYSLY